LYPKRGDWNGDWFLDRYIRLLNLKKKEKKTMKRTFEITFPYASVDVTANDVERCLKTMDHICLEFHTDVSVRLVDGDKELIDINVELRNQITELREDLQAFVCDYDMERKHHESTKEELEEIKAKNVDLGEVILCYQGYVNTLECDLNKLHKTATEKEDTIATLLNSFQGVCEDNVFLQALSDNLQSSLSEMQSIQTMVVQYETVYPRPEAFRALHIGILGCLMDQPNDIHAYIEDWLHKHMAP